MSAHAKAPRWSRRLRKSPHLVTAAVLVAVAVPMSFAGPASAALQPFPGNFTVVQDQNGADDVQGQFDISQLGRDNTDATYLKMFWSWDDPTFSGANTGDACALLDTNGNGNVDISICTVVQTTKGHNAITELAGNPTVSTCNDAWTDRCGQPTNLAYTFGTDILAGAMNFAGGNPLGSPPNDLVTETDPFHASPNDFDSTVEVYLAKAFLAAKNATLINVCSYPSSGFGASNNDPKDCIVNPGNGALVIVKDAGSDTTTQFPFTVSPVPAAGNPVTITGSNSSSAIPMAVGSNASVTEAVPAGWLFNAGSCTLAGGGSTGTTSVANTQITGITIEAGKTTTCTIKDVSDAHISLTKQANPTQYSAAGQAITYTLTATNDGNSTLSGVTITDADAGVSVNSPCTPAQPATLNPGDTLVCTASYTTTAADVTNGSFTNHGHVEGTAPDGSTHQANADATITAIGPELTLTKVASPVTYTDAGQTITYTLTATNSGNVQLDNVSITDADLGVTLNPNPCTAATLAVGATLTCSATYTTTAADVTAGHFTNTANAAGTDHVLGLPVNATPATATVKLAQLSLTKAASPTTYDDSGVAITYTLVATNTGNSVLNNVSITDTDAGVTLNPSPCTVGSLAIGATLTCHASYTTTAADVTAKSFTNTANAAGTSQAGQPVIASAQATIKLAHLSLTKTPSPTTFGGAGTQITYTLVATNDGNVPLTNVSISDLDPGVTLDSAKCNPVQPVASLAVGATITCTATYITTAADVANGKFTNVASADGTDPSRQPVSASASATVNFNAPPPPPPPPGTPNLTLAKTSVPPTGSTVQPGDLITYTLSYANTGNAVANTVVTSDVLPAGLTFVSASNGGTYDVATNTISWALNNVAAGASGTVSFVAAVVSTATNGQTITNLGTISAAGLNPVQSNPDTVTVNVPPAPPVPTLAIVKQVDHSVAEYGDTLTYTFTVTAGGADQTGVIVTDQLPDGTAYVPASATCSTGCNGTLAAGIVTWDIGDMAAGDTVTLTFQVTITSPTPDANGGIPPETIVNFGTVGSGQVDPVDSNQVKTQVTAVLGISKNKPPTKPQPSPLPFTGLPFPLLQTVVLSSVMIVTGLWLTRPRRRRPLA